MEYDPEDPERDYDGRRPPQDIDAERAVLGSMMLSKDAVSVAVEELVGRDFYRPAHEFIFDVMVDMYGEGKAPDVITVAHELTELGIIAKVGGGVYVHGLVESPTLIPANVEYYAAIVREKATLRRVVDAGGRIMQVGYSEADADDVVDQAQAYLYEALPRSLSEDYVPVADIMSETLDEIEANGSRDGGLTGVPTGFLDLDDLMGGLHPGQMVTVAGRPASGKSTLGVDFCRAAAIHNNMAAVIFSLEMTRTEITMRLLSAEARVPLSSIRSGNVSDADWQRIARAMPAISASPLFIDDSPNLHMSEIRAKARRLKQNHDLRLIVIDYLQLMTSGKRVENRQVEVSEFSRQIKLLAKELGVPVVALSQLNRGPEQRTSKRPMMSDLRESGSIEQDSDVVVLVHREDMYEAESSRPGEADLIVAKHRNGPTRDVTVAFQGHYARFVDMAHG